MPGTRASTIRADIGAIFAGLTLDHRAGSADKWKVLDVPRRPDTGVADRTARVIVAVPPRRSNVLSGDLFEVEFVVELYLALARGVDDRTCDDIERAWWGLETMQTRNAGIELSTPAHLGAEPTEHNLIVRLSVVVLYRLDSALIN